MKLISWNVAGFRASIKKGALDFFNDVNADIICLQETKMNKEQLDVEINGYYQYWNSALKKGYSGTLILTKFKPLNVTYGMGIDIHDQEGRIITLEFNKFFLVTVYTPNAKNNLERLDYRMNWDDDFKDYLSILKTKKEVIVCGDLNVAHKEIDLKNPKENIRSAGFTIEERNKFTDLLNSGFIDTYRYFYPDKTDIYTWWSYITHARNRNVGWRIDYFLISSNLISNLKKAIVYNDIYGSDHCPIGIEMTINDKEL